MAFQKFLFSIILCTATLAGFTSKAQQHTNITTNDFEKGIEQPGIQLLDVRTSAEYQSGHLKNAFLADWTNKEQFIERVKALDKSKPIYTYCLSGARSAAAMKWLNGNGYTALNLDGGIAAWKRAGKAVEEVVKVNQITLAEFHALIPNDKTVLVDIGAVWCPPCKKMNPVIDSLAASNELQFNLVKIDGGEQTEISSQLKAEAFPTFIVYKKGKEIWRASGVVEGSVLAQHLK